MRVWLGLKLAQWARVTALFCVRSLVWSMVYRRGWSRTEVEKIVTREVDAILSSVEGHYSYQEAEGAALTERLGRRFDPGMALNEATQRAIAAKKAAGEADPVYLSTQSAALRFQEEYLKRIIEQA